MQDVMGARVKDVAGGVGVQDAARWVRVHVGGGLYRAMQVSMEQAEAMRPPVPSILRPGTLAVMQGLRETRLRWPSRERRARFLRDIGPAGREVLRGMFRRDAGVDQ